MSLVRAMTTADILTENGAPTHSTSSSQLVDLFFKINAMRGSTEDEILKLWTLAFGADPLDAMRILFYSRDIRGGQGERRVFRVILRDLAERHPDVVRKNLHLVPEYGRWDDLFVLFGTSLEKDILGYIRQSLVGDKNALCAKWMPREGSANSKLAKKIREYMELSPKQYRQLLSSLTKVVETQMCARDWTGIKFEHVPSYAMKNYRKAFARHDGTRWVEYLTALEKGETKVNASTLYPHDLVKQVMYGENRLLDQQWLALPNYMAENNERMIPVCDVSGSMSGLPMEVCVALGLYISERNQGPFKDAFITFSDNPKMQIVKGKTLSERVNCLSNAEWGGSTNLEKVFQVLLTQAKKHHVSAEQMPTMILIMSDMQFNVCVNTPKSTLMESIRQQYAESNYELPKVVFWNLRDSFGVPVKFDERGTALVSGFSPSILTSLLSGNGISPVSVMRSVLDKPRYAAINV